MSIGLLIKDQITYMLNLILFSIASTTSSEINPKIRTFHFVRYKLIIKKNIEYIQEKL